MKGYLYKKDIIKFMPCGSSSAALIFHDIRRKVEQEGYENCRDVILAKRMLDYIGTDLPTLMQLAKIEKENNKEEDEE